MIASDKEFPVFEQTNIGEYNEILVRICRKSEITDARMVGEKSLYSPAKQHLLVLLDEQKRTQYGTAQGVVNLSEDLIQFVTNEKLWTDKVKVSVFFIETVASMVLSDAPETKTYCGMHIFFEASDLIAHRAFKKPRASVLAPYNAKLLKDKSDNKLIYHFLPQAWVELLQGRSLASVKHFRKYSLQNNRFCLSAVLYQLFHDATAYNPSRILAQETLKEFQRPPFDFETLTRLFTHMQVLRDLPVNQQQRISEIHDVMQTLAAPTESKRIKTTPGQKPSVRDSGSMERPDYKSNFGAYSSNSQGFWGSSVENYGGAKVVSEGPKGYDLKALLLDLQMINNPGDASEIVQSYCRYINFRMAYMQELSLDTNLALRTEQIAESLLGPNISTTVKMLLDAGKQIADRATRIQMLFGMICDKHLFRSAPEQSASSIIKY